VYHCCWGACEQQTIVLQLLTHFSVFKLLILLEMVPSQPYARQFLVCGTSRRKGSCSLHNASTALDHSNNVLLVMHISPHCTFEGQDSLGRANFFPQLSKDSTTYTTEGMSPLQCPTTATCYTAHLTSC